MPDAIQEATFALNLWAKISKSPYTQLLIDKIASTGNWMPYLGGPLVKDFLSTYQNFKDQHNVARNMIYALVVVTSSVLCIYFSVTEPEFRKFLGVFATTFNIVKDASSITIETYAYLDYLLSTYAAAIVTDGVLDIAFICQYGDREFRPLLESEAQTIAHALDEDVEVVKEEYANRIQQLRNKHFAPGAESKDIREALIAIKNNPTKAIHLCAELDKAFNAHLEHLRTTHNAKHAMLAQYKRTIFVTARALADAPAEQTHTRRQSGPNVPFLAGSEGRHDEFPTYGTVNRPGTVNTLSAV